MGESPKRRRWQGQLLRFPMPMYCSSRTFEFYFRFSKLPDTHLMEVVRALVCEAYEVSSLTSVTWTNGCLSRSGFASREFRRSPLNSRLFWENALHENPCKAILPTLHCSGSIPKHFGKGVLEKSEASRTIQCTGAYPSILLSTQTETWVRVKRRPSPQMR
jgi:hypothetical protein